MQPLATEFEDRIFCYTQIERQGDIAIYRQTHKLGQVERFEVVKIRIAPEHTWPNGTTSPEREVYPGSPLWGSAGWTTHALKEAKALAQSLQTAQHEHQADDDASA